MSHATGDIFEIRVDRLGDEGGRARKRRDEQPVRAPAYVLLPPIHGLFACILGVREPQAELAQALEDAGKGLWIDASMAGINMFPAAFFDCRWVFTYPAHVLRPAPKVGYVEDRKDRCKVARAVFNGVELAADWEADAPPGS